MSDPRIERERNAGMEAALGRFGEDFGEGGLSMLVQTAAEAVYPTVPNAFFAVHPVEIDGGQDEGDTPTFITDPTRTFHAYNLGSALPPVGTVAIAHARSGRWTFTFNCCPA